MALLADGELVSDVTELSKMRRSLGGRSVALTSVGVCSILPAKSIDIRD